MTFWVCTGQMWEKTECRMDQDLCRSHMYAHLCHSHMLISTHKTVERYVHVFCFTFLWMATFSLTCWFSLFRMMECDGDCATFSACLPPPSPAIFFGHPFFLTLACLSRFLYVAGLLLVPSLPIFHHSPLFWDLSGLH